MSLTEKELTFLKGNSSWSSFYASLLSQYENKGELSPKQVACVISGMEKQAAREVEKAVPAKKEYTLQVGQTVAIKRWLASSLAE